MMMVSELLISTSADGMSATVMVFTVPCLASTWPNDLSAGVCQGSRHTSTDDEGRWQMLTDVRDGVAAPPRFGLQVTRLLSRREGWIE